MPGKGARVAIRFLGTPGLVGIVVLMVWLDHTSGGEMFYIPLLVAAFGVGSLVEVYRMFGLKGYRPASVAGCIALGALLISPLMRDVYAPLGPLSIGGLFLLYIMGKVVARYGRFSLESAGMTLFGFAYVGMIWAVFVAEKFGDRTATFLLFLLVASKLPDTAGYLVGKTLGRHKMTPAISPNKTWEGGIAGLVVGVAGGLFVCLQYDPFKGFFGYTPPLIALILFCTAVTVAAMLGDLVKSALKRWAGVKDSGFIPEFGGFLDITDSFLLSAPTAALGFHLLEHILARTT